MEWRSYNEAIIWPHRGYNSFWSMIALKSYNYSPPSYPFGALVSRGIYIHAMFFFKSVPLLWGFSHEPLASGPGARRWRGWQDLKPVYLVALGRFLSHFLWAVRTAPGETPVFRSIRDCGRNQCFRCFCGSVGSAVFAVPLANATRALAPHCPFFFLSLSPLFIH